MASNIHISAATRKGMMDGTLSIITQANSGKLTIWSGTQPTDGDTAVGAQVNLANLVMNATSFTGPSGTASTDQVLTAGAITSDTNAAATNTATWFRLYKSDHTTGDTGTRIMDGSVGTASADCNLNSVSIVAATTVAVTAMTLTLPK